MDAQEYELEPAPRSLTRWIARELNSLAGLSRLNSRLASVLRRAALRFDRQNLPIRQGEFCIRLGEIEVKVLMWVHGSKLGDRYFLTLETRPDKASALATDEIKRVFEIAQYRSPLELCPDLW